MAGDLPMLRPVREALDPAIWAERVLGAPLDTWQSEVLRATQRQMVLNCSRQAGKSTVAALLALHVALFAPPGALVLLVSPSLRQSAEIFRRVLGYARDCHAPIVQESVLRLELAGGSRIVSLPGSEATIRGYSAPALVVVDEAARVPDELYLGAVRPMRATNPGRLLLLSTPAGRTGFFHQIWMDGAAGWQRVRVPATECPRISPEWLEEERAALPDFVFRAEYLCEFLDSELAAFAGEDVAAALDTAVLPLEGWR